MKKSLGFTLVELMIVIAIIGVLSASLFPSLSNYLSRGRDVNRISDVNIINTALIAHKLDRGTYHIQGTGWLGGGEGWANYSGVNYSGSMTVELKNLGYLSKDIPQYTSIYTDPITRNISPCVALGHSQGMYMIYFNDGLGRYSVSGYLENPTTKNISDIQLSYASQICTVYGRNYALGIN